MPVARPTSWSPTESLFPDDMEDGGIESTAAMHSVKLVDEMVSIANHLSFRGTIQEDDEPPPT